MHKNEHKYNQGYLNKISELHQCHDPGCESVYHGFARCWEKLDKRVDSSLCIISYDCM